MNWYEILLIIYGVVGIAILVRGHFVVRKMKTEWKAQGVTPSQTDLYGALVEDAILWPWRVLWFGLRDFTRDL